MAGVRSSVQPVSERCRGQESWRMRAHRRESVRRCCDRGLRRYRNGRDETFSKLFRVIDRSDGSSGTVQHSWLVAMAGTKKSKRSLT
jgi:hypothetical protein